MTLDQLLQANELIDTVPIKGKPYATVFERIKAFRNVAPNATIETEIISIDADSVTMKAVVYDEDGHKLGVGHAQELKTSSFVNETSYVENCETSAVGRALGMCAVGIDKSFASADELANALLNQGKKKPDEVTEAIQSAKKDVTATINQKQLKGLKDKCKEAGVSEADVCDHMGVNSLSELTYAKYAVLAADWSRVVENIKSLEGIPFK